MKICKKCHLEKLESEFNKRYCKSCDRNIRIQARLLLVSKGLCFNCGKNPQLTPGSPGSMCQQCYDAARPGKKRRRKTEEAKAYSRNYYAHNLEKMHMTQKDQRDKTRKQVLDHYGWKCNCCGETTPEFLTVDHINNDGAEHRKLHHLTSSYQQNRWIIKNNFPEDFQTLCFNCNCGKKINGGTCPHLVGKAGGFGSPV